MTIEEATDILRENRIISEVIYVLDAGPIKYIYSVWTRPDDSKLIICHLYSGKQKEIIHRFDSEDHPYLLIAFEEFIS